MPPRKRNNEPSGGVKIPKSYSLLEEIKKSKLFKKSGSTADDIARKKIEESCKTSAISRYAKAGQLILFKYLEPKTKEELEYYDASPCTIFFGTFKAKEGKRILGFNIHYYPRNARFNIMDKIFKMYRPVYAKYFDTGLTTDLDAFDYRYLIDQLEEHGLGFGVRMYIPSLASEPRVINPDMWTTAVYTEGWFKKRTKAAIVQYWRQWVQKGGQVKSHKVSKKAKINKATKAAHRKVLRSNYEE